MGHSPLRVVVPVCVLLCAAVLVGCGAGEDSPGQKLIKQTLGSEETAIGNGELRARFEFFPTGATVLGGPLSIELQGPFEAPVDGRAPRLDLFVDTLSGETEYPGAIASTGSDAYLRLDEREYTVDDDLVGGLREGLSSKTGDERTGLWALGIDPRRWITSHDKQTSPEPVAGVETVRVDARVDAAVMLKDISRLLTAIGGFSAALLSPELIEQIDAGVTEASVMINARDDDKRLREISASVELDLDGSGSPQLAGLTGGGLNVRLRVSGPGETAVKVAKPAHARPLSGAIGGNLADVRRGFETGLSSGPSRPAGRRLRRCLTASNGKSVVLLRCLSKLAR